MTGHLPSSPAAERNRPLILRELQRRLAPTARILEIASGLGQHAQHCAGAMSGWTWQPTDADPTLPAVIDERCRGLANVRPTIVLDVLEASWPLRTAASAGPTTDATFDAIICANMLHVSRWPTCRALMRGAAAHLRHDRAQDGEQQREAGGLLFLYGPYRRTDVPTAPSNEAFDADLRARNPQWGLRDLADVTREAQAAGLALCEVVEMPANNLLVVFGVA